MVYIQDSYNPMTRRDSVLILEVLRYVSSEVVHFFLVMLFTKICFAFTLFVVVDSLIGLLV